MAQPEVNQHPAEKTPFEREIDAVSSFDPAAVLQPLPSYREPLNVVCGCCGRKHCYLGCR